MLLTSSQASRKLHQHEIGCFIAVPLGCLCPAYSKQLNGVMLDKQEMYRIGQVAVAPSGFAALSVQQIINQQENIHQSWHYSRNGMAVSKELCAPCCLILYYHNTVAKCLISITNAGVCMSFTC